MKAPTFITWHDAWQTLITQEIATPGSVVGKPLHFKIRINSCKLRPSMAAYTKTKLDMFDRQYIIPGEMGRVIDQLNTQDGPVIYDFKKHGKNCLSHIEFFKTASGLKVDVEANITNLASQGLIDFIKIQSILFEIRRQTGFALDITFHTKKVTSEKVMLMPIHHVFASAILKYKTSKHVELLANALAKSKDTSYHRYQRMLKNIKRAEDEV